MQNSRRGTTVFFIHIPKTAGTTLHDILGRQYAASRSFKTGSRDHEVWPSLETFSNMEADRRGQLGLVRGHCVLSVEGLITGPKQFVAFLRDPLQHFRSLFYYIRRATWNPHHDRVVRLAGLAEFLDYQVEYGFDNMQTRHLSGELGAMLPQVSGDPVARAVDAALYQQAVSWLERLGQVGLTDRFDESLLLMRDVLGWQRHCYYQVHNRTKGRPDTLLDPMLLERFEEVQAWDIALHAKAQELFELSIKAQGPGFAGRVRRFRGMNAVAQSVYQMKNWLVK